MAGMGFDQRNNFQNTPNMGGGGAPMNGRSNGAPFPSPPHGFAMNQQHPSPGGPLFGSAFPFNNNFTVANNNQIGFSNARFMPHDNNHGVPPTPMNSPAFWQGPPNMNGIVTSPFGTHSYGNAGMIATQPMNCGRPSGYGGNAPLQYDGRVTQMRTPGQVRSSYVGNPGNRSEYAFGG
uniref:Uncharacterized protein n=1 Tax=Parascaris univalens TaxID=6257 RepID=A0A915C4J4_PARUN